MLVLFVVITIILVAANPQKSPAKVSESINSEGVRAIASAMPNQGWAPLRVYFSAYGSQSDFGQIKKTEWDLDGNGLFDSDASQNQGYVDYVYTKPGDYLVTMRVTDDQGNTGFDNIVISVRHPASSSVDYWTIFDDGQVQRVEIQLTSADYALMWTDIESKITVPADAIIFGEKLENVGFRMRGQFSLRVSGEKKPWKIDTDAYVDGQEYHNLKQLMFINNIGDSSMLLEKLAYDMMHFAGLHASFVSYIDLWIDFSDDDQGPIFWGVYSMIERIDQKFLSNRFGRDNRHGNLYKASHAQRGPMDLIYYGPTIESYPSQEGQYAYGKASNEGENDYSDVIQLAYVIDGVQYESPEDFATAVEKVMNVDSFLRYMAVMNTLSSWDIYPYTGNNFYLYNNPGTGKFEWLPWDLTWDFNAQASLFSLDGPGLVDRAPLYDRVFEVERYRLQYAAYLDLLARNWFNYENISQQAQGYFNLISPYVSQSTGDKMFYGETGMIPLEEFQNSWIAIADFAKERSSFILNSLSQIPEISE